MTPMHAKNNLAIRLILLIAFLALAVFIQPSFSSQTQAQSKPNGICYQGFWQYALDDGTLENDGEPCGGSGEPAPACDSREFSSDYCTGVCGVHRYRYYDNCSQHFFNEDQQDDSCTAGCATSGGSSGGSSGSGSGSGSGTGTGTTAPLAACYSQATDPVCVSCHTAMVTQYDSCGYDAPSSYQYPDPNCEGTNLPAGQSCDLPVHNACNITATTQDTVACTGGHQFCRYSASGNYWSDCIPDSSSGSGSSCQLQNYCVSCQQAIKANTCTGDVTGQPVYDPTCTDESGKLPAGQTCSNAPPPSGAPPVSSSPNCDPGASYSFCRNNQPIRAYVSSVDEIGQCIFGEQVLDPNTDGAGVCSGTPNPNSSPVYNPGSSAYHKLIGNTCIEITADDNGQEIQTVVDNSLCDSDPGTASGGTGPITKACTDEGLPAGYTYHNRIVVSYDGQTPDCGEPDYTAPATASLPASGPGSVDAYNNCLAENNFDESACSNIKPSDQQLSSAACHDGEPLCSGGKRFQSKAEFTTDENGQINSCHLVVNEIENDGSCQAPKSAACTSDPGCGAGSYCNLGSGLCESLPEGGQQVADTCIASGAKIIVSGDQVACAGGGGVKPVAAPLPDSKKALEAYNQCLVENLDSPEACVDLKPAGASQDCPEKRDYCYNGKLWETTRTAFDGESCSYSAPATIPDKHLDCEGSNFSAAAAIPSPASNNAQCPANASLTSKGGGYYEVDYQQIEGDKCVSKKFVSDKSKAEELAKQLGVTTQTLNTGETVVNGILKSFSNPLGNLVAGASNVGKGIWDSPVGAIVSIGPIGLVTGDHRAIDYLAGEEGKKQLEAINYKGPQVAGIVGGNILHQAGNAGGAVLETLGGDFDTAVANPIGAGIDLAGKLKDNPDQIPQAAVQIAAIPGQMQIDFAKNIVDGTFLGDFQKGAAGVFDSNSEYKKQLEECINERNPDGSLTDRALNCRNGVAGILVAGTTATVATAGIGEGVSGAIATTGLSLPAQIAGFTVASQSCSILGVNDTTCQISLLGAGAGGVVEGPLKGLAQKGTGLVTGAKAIDEAGQLAVDSGKVEGLVTALGKRPTVEELAAAKNALTPEEVKYLDALLERGGAKPAESVLPVVDSTVPKVENPAVLSTGADAATGQPVTTRTINDVVGQPAPSEFKGTYKLEGDPNTYIVGADGNTYKVRDGKIVGGGPTTEADLGRVEGQVPVAPETPASPVTAAPPERPAVNPVVDGNDVPVSEPIAKPAAAPETPGGVPEEVPCPVISLLPSSLTSTQVLGAKIAAACSKIQVTTVDGNNKTYDLNKDSNDAVIKKAIDDYKSGGSKDAEAYAQALGITPDEFKTLANTTDTKKGLYTDAGSNIKAKVEAALDDTRRVTNPETILPPDLEAQAKDGVVYTPKLQKNPDGTTSIVFQDGKPVYEGSTYSGNNRVKLPDVAYEPNLKPEDVIPEGGPSLFDRLSGKNPPTTYRSRYPVDGEFVRGDSPEAVIAEYNKKVEAGLPKEPIVTNPAPATPAVPAAPVSAPSTGADFDAKLADIKRRLGNGEITREQAAGELGLNTIDWDVVSRSINKDTSTYQRIRARAQAHLDAQIPETPVVPVARSTEPITPAPPAGSEPGVVVIKPSAEDLNLIEPNVQVIRTPIEPPVRITPEDLGLAPGGAFDRAAHPRARLTYVDKYRRIYTDPDTGVEYIEYYAPPRARVSAVDSSETPGGALAEAGDHVAPGAAPVTPLAAEPVVEPVVVTEPAARDYLKNQADDVVKKIESDYGKDYGITKANYEAEDNAARALGLKPIPEAEPAAANKGAVFDLSQTSPEPGTGGNYVTFKDGTTLYAEVPGAGKPGLDPLARSANEGGVKHQQIAYSMWEGNPERGIVARPDNPVVFSGEYRVDADGNIVVDLQSGTFSGRNFGLRAEDIPTQRPTWDPNQTNLEDLEKVLNGSSAKPVHAVANSSNPNLSELGASRARVNELLNDADSFAARPPEPAPAAAVPAVRAPVAIVPSGESSGPLSVIADKAKAAVTSKPALLVAAGYGGSELLCLVGHFSCPLSPLLGLVQQNSGNGPPQPAAPTQADKSVGTPPQNPAPPAVATGPKNGDFGGKCVNDSFFGINTGNPHCDGSDLVCYQGSCQKPVAAAGKSGGACIEKSGLGAPTLYTCSDDSLKCDGNLCVPIEGPLTQVPKTAEQVNCEQRLAEFDCANKQNILYAWNGKQCEYRKTAMPTSEYQISCPQVNVSPITCSDLDHVIGLSVSGLCSSAREELNKGIVGSDACNSKATAAFDAVNACKPLPINLGSIPKDSCKPGDAPLACAVGHQYCADQGNGTFKWGECQNEITHNPGIVYKRLEEITKTSSTKAIDSVIPFGDGSYISYDCDTKGNAWIYRGSLEDFNQLGTLAPEARTDMLVGVQQGGCNNAGATGVLSSKGSTGDRLNAQAVTSTTKPPATTSAPVRTGSTTPATSPAVSSSPTSPAAVQTADSPMCTGTSDAVIAKVQADDCPGALSIISAASSTCSESVAAQAKADGYYCTSIAAATPAGTSTKQKEDVVVSSDITKKVCSIDSECGDANFVCGKYEKVCTPKVSSSLYYPDTNTRVTGLSECPTEEKDFGSQSCSSDGPSGKLYQHKVQNILVPNGKDSSGKATCSISQKDLGLSNECKTQAPIQTTSTPASRLATSQALLSDPAIKGAPDCTTLQDCATVPSQLKHLLQQGNQYINANQSIGGIAPQDLNVIGMALVNLAFNWGDANNIKLTAASPFPGLTKVQSGGASVNQPGVQNGGREKVSGKVCDVNKFDVSTWDLVSSNACDPGKVGFAAKWYNCLNGGISVDRYTDDVAADFCKATTPATSSSKGSFTSITTSSSGVTTTVTGNIKFHCEGKNIIGSGNGQLVTVVCATGCTANASAGTAVCK